MTTLTPLPVVSPTVTPAVRPAVRPVVNPSVRPSASPVVRPLGEQSLPRIAVKLDRRGGNPPAAKKINLDAVPQVNGVIQTVLPHMPDGYIYH